MPGFDRTGPRGTGPMTGWGRGLCATGTVTQTGTTVKETTEEGAAAPADVAQANVNAPVYGLGRGGIPRGCGRGFGGGRGRRCAASGRGFGGGGRGRF